MWTIGSKYIYLKLKKSNKISEIYTKLKKKVANRNFEKCKKVYDS